MMNDLIDRKALLGAILNDVAPINVDMLCKHIHNAPTITPESLVRHGRWVEYENEADKGFHYCSKCRAQAFNYEDGQKVVEVLANYCHNCGAKMDLEDL